jgi:hypothetical protein
VLLNPPAPNEFLTQAAEKYNEEVEKKEPFSDMLVPTDTPLPTDTPTPLPTDTPTPTPTPTETGTPTPTPTYLDKINVIARENSFFNSPAEGYTDEQFVDEIPTSLLEDAINEFNQESIEEENQIIDEIQIDTTSSEEDEKKNLTEFQPQTLDLVISEDLEIEEVMETSESIDYSTKSQVEDLYWEKDDNNPNQIIYDLENNQVIIPSSEEEIITPTPTPKNVISRNVSTRRRNFR